MILCALIVAAGSINARAAEPAAGATRFAASETAFTEAGAVAPAPLPSDYGLRAHAWVLEGRKYFDPFVADIRGDNIKIGLPYATLFKAYEYGDPAGNRTVGREHDIRSGTDISLGREIGLVGFERGLAAPPADAPGGCPPDEAQRRLAMQERLRRAMPGAGFMGIGLWTSLSWHMLWDILGPSAPIVNNDYRFGLAAKGMWQPAGTVALRAALKVGHESSHLGDELTLANEGNPAFTRVNVSYEFWDPSLGFSLALRSAQAGALERLGYAVLSAPFIPRRWFTAAGAADRVTFDLKAGVVLLHDADAQGYYAYVLSETHGLMLRRSRSTTEPYVAVTLAEAREGAKWFIAADLRDRIIYKYLPADDTSAETRQLSTNLLVGVKDVRDPVVSQLSSIYVRYYRGVNPNGQFRNQAGFWLLGLGVSLDL